MCNGAYFHREVSSSHKNSTFTSDFLHAILLLLEISLFHVHASITSDSCCHASAFASQMCNISSESLMIELKSVLLLLLSAVMEYRCDCIIEYLQYSSHEQLRLSASVQAAADALDSNSISYSINDGGCSSTTIANNSTNSGGGSDCSSSSSSSSSNSSTGSSTSSVFPQSLRTCGAEEIVPPLFSGVLLSGDVGDLYTCTMRLLDACDTVLQAAVALLHVGTNTGQKFQRETIDSIHTSVLIDIAK